MRSREQFKIQNSKYKNQKGVLLVSKRGPFEGQKDNYWKAKGVVFEF